MRNKTILAVAFMANMAFAKSYEISSQNIVCCFSNEIKMGVNEVSLMADAFDLFPTMDMLVRFDPPMGVIGDDLVFDLDGKHRRYRFESWDGTNYVLTTTTRWQPPEIGLDWIPLRKQFWINHVSTNVVQVLIAGQLGDEHMRKMSLVPRIQKRHVEIQLVSDDDKKAHILFGN